VRLASLLQWTIADQSVPIDDIQQRWIAKNPGRRVDDIEMRTVQPGSIVVPGMSGQSPFQPFQTHFSLLRFQTLMHISWSTEPVSSYHYIKLRMSTVRRFVHQPEERETDDL
jgi:hypothetical protein